MVRVHTYQFSRAHRISAGYMLTIFEGITEFCYVQSESYQDAQLEFLECVESHDPNNIVLLNRYYPYHIDCLVQISEIAKHSGDWTVAGECIGTFILLFYFAFSCNVLAKF